MVNGSVSETPSTQEGTCCANGIVMPIFWASLIGSHMPVSSSSWAKKVFTDCWVPV